MSYQEGEIYFIREKSADGSLSPFVKIGLVRDAEGRDSFNRLAEHQTGNPRTLDLQPDCIVKTAGVDMVEAQMHRLYANQRVSGEWFEFSDDQAIATAVARAQALADEAAAIVPLFGKAEALSAVDSNGVKRSPTEAETALGIRLAVAKMQISLCEEQQTRIKSLIAISAEAGEDVSKVASTSSRTFAPKFMESEFKVAHPDIFEKYQYEVPGRNHSFTCKTKVDLADLGEDFLSAYNEVVSIIDSVTEHSLVPRLNGATLTLTHLVGLAKWEVEVTSAELKLAMQDVEEIKGVCGWKRYDKVSMKFDARLFAEENNDLASKFMSEAITKQYVRTKKTKS